MLRLKSRQQACPDGFRYEQRETGYRNWMVDPHTVWDFNGLVQAVANHRLANKGRFPGFNTNVTDIANEIDHVNALRVSRIAGADIYLIEDNAGASPPKPMPPSSQQAYAAEASYQKPEMDSLLASWLGEGGGTVSNEEAVNRAKVCLVCPMNRQGDWTRYFSLPMANMLRQTLEMRNGMKLQTPDDPKLGICEACSCVLTLKIHVEPSVIKRKMAKETFDGLHENCWIRKL
jgi:hypothetical protein